MQPILKPGLNDDARRAPSLLLPAAPPLRLGVVCTIGPMRFMPFLARLRRDHPGLQLAITEATPERLVAMLDSAALDAAVIAQPAPFAAGIAARLLYRERFAVALPPGHRLARQRAVALGDLHGESYVERSNCEYGAFIDGLLRKRSVELRIVYRSEREEWVQMMILSGAGLACLPEHGGLLPGLPLRRLVRPVLYRDIYLVTRARGPVAPAMPAFLAAAAAFPWGL